jgi:hypothetical protein
VNAGYRETQAPALDQRHSHHLHDESPSPRRLFYWALRTVPELRRLVESEAPDVLQFMGSAHGLSVVHDALEPGRFGGRPSTINLSTINQFMGSVSRLETARWRTISVTTFPSSQTTPGMLDSPKRAPRVRVHAHHTQPRNRPTGIRCRRPGGGLAVAEHGRLAGAQTGLVELGRDQGLPATGAERE